MSRHQLPPQQQAMSSAAGGSGASWAQRRPEYSSPQEAQQVEMGLRKHEQTTEATRRAAQVRPR